MWKEIFVWCNAAMTEKSTQILKIFSKIVINTNCLLLSSSSNQAEKFNFNWGQPWGLVGNCPLNIDNMMESEDCCFVPVRCL